MSRKILVNMTMVCTHLYSPVGCGVVGPQALLLSVRCADVYTCMYIKGQRDPSLLWLSDLTEVGSPMISRVNNDVTLGLTTGHWSTPL